MKSREETHSHIEIFPTKRGVCALENRRPKKQSFKELLRQQTILTRFGELALRSDDLDEILTEACHLVGEALGTDLAKVVELHEDGHTLTVRAGIGWRPDVVGVTNLDTADKTSESLALEVDEPVISPDIATETRFKYPAFMVDNGVKAFVNVVIKGSSGRPPFGILQVDSRQPRQFTDQDSDFLRSYANLLAAAVSRLSALVELRQKETRLRESEGRLTRAIAAAGISTWEWDTAGDALQFSSGYEALHGQAVGSLPSFADLQRVVIPEDWPAVAVALDRAANGERQGVLAVQFRVRLSDGSQRWLRTTGSAELDTAGVITRLAGVTQDITTSRTAEEHVAHMARHDGLTGLLNRRALHERLEDALRRSERGETCAVLALDLDRFKDVNDTLGHAAGDAVLCSVASRLREAMRETDVVARPGGDEFVVIQFGLHQVADVEILATRLVESLSEPHAIDGHSVMTGVSIGIAIAPTDGAAVDRVLQCADLALYGAKRDEAVHFRFFEPSMQARAQERRQLVADLHQALVNNEFELHYQPLIDLAQNKIAGFEALVRWRHPVRGLIPPDAFIPIAEETGLIEPLGEWILFKACADAVAWPPEMKVAVNLSVVQFTRGYLLGTVAAAMERAGLTPGRLELEITESLLLHDTEATLATLYQLRTSGASISIDDFGIGYSSLSYLSKFPLDKVKIDRTFVATAGNGGNGAAIIHAVVDLCRSLGITTTAEGIETPEQLEQVVGLGCNEGQGYLFAQPRPLADISALIESW